MALVAACGGAPAAPAPSSGSNNPSANPAPTAAPAVVSGKTTLLWFAARDTTGYTPKQVEAFNKSSDKFVIDYQEQGATTTDLHDKYVTAAAAKDSSVDIVSMDAPFVAEFAAAGWVAPVDFAMSASDKSAFFPGLLDGSMYDGKLFAVPFYNNGPGLFYRKDLLDAKKLAPPKTYDELLAVAKATQTPEVQGLAMQINQGEAGIISFLEYLWGYGGDLLDNKLKVVVDQGDAGVKAMQRIMDFVFKDKILPEAAVQYRTGADAMNVFAGGKAVMLRIWFSNVAALYAQTAAIKPDQWDVVPLPSNDASKAGPGCLGHWGLGISSASKKIQAAAEVIKQLTNAESNKTRFLGGSFLPARPAAYEDAEVLAKYPYAKKAQLSFNVMKARPVTPFYADISKNALQPAFGQAMANSISAAEAVKQIAEKARGILK